MFKSVHMEQMLIDDVVHQEEEKVTSQSWDDKKVADDMTLASKHEVQLEQVVDVLVVDKTCGAAHLWVIGEVKKEWMPYHPQVIVVVLAFQMASIVKVYVWIKVLDCVQFFDVWSIWFYEQNFYDNLHDGTCKVGVLYEFVYMHMIFIVLFNPFTNPHPPRKGVM